MGLLLKQITVILAFQLSVSFSWARVLGLRPARGNQLFFKGTLPDITTASRHDGVVLHCTVGGREPTIHWLKDGVRIQQGESRDYRNDQALYEDTGAMTGKSFTSSKLFLDCVDEASEGVYTCIGETPTERITQSTNLVLKRPSDFLDLPEVAADEFSHRTCLEKRSVGNTAARIFLWTSLRLEQMGESVQVFCRSEGFPSPQVEWFDSNNTKILPTSSQFNDFEILENGDLLIKRLQWKHMGTYKCSASNGEGSDTQEIFIYPFNRPNN